MDLRHKVCMITGGTSGIGAATAAALVKRGAHVAVVSRTFRREMLDSLKTLASTQDCEFLFVQGDLGNADDCRRSVDVVSSVLGRVDVLVHAAGHAFRGGLFDISDVDWLKAFDTHVHSSFWLARAVAPHMVRQKSGAILFIGSAAGLRGCAGAIAYGVAKGALPQFARALARELANDNIRVNCVSPGIIRTPFQDTLTPEQVETNIKDRIPLHREGQPEDVAHAIVCLLENEFVTGENFVVDGGMSMRMV